MMCWVPQSSDIGLGVSILSYAGAVQFGVIADRRLCPDPRALIDAFAPEFERLLLLAAMLPAELFGPGLDPDRLERALFGAPPSGAHGVFGASVAAHGPKRPRTASSV
jgi:hypothetical protein